MNLGIETGTSCEPRGRIVYILYSALLAFFLAIATVFAVLPGAVQAQTYTFNSVQVEGNQRIETATIISYLGIDRGKSVSAGQLNDAYQRVLDSGVFETVDLDPKGSTLVVRVTEYPTINQINFEGNRRIDDDDLVEIISSEPRRVFNPAQVESDATLLAEVYSQQGRISATVTPRIIRRSENRVDLIFEISEGGTIEVERISFVGNTVFSDRRLRRILETKQAGIFRTFIRSDTLVEDRIEFDKQVLRDFYLSRGYVDFRTNSANVELTRERDAYFLVLNIQEGQQYKFGQITTISEIDGADPVVFQEALRIKTGVVFSPTLVESSIARQERLALDQGIDFLRVEPRITRNERELTLDVEFVLSKGPRVFVERIDIEGNTTTLDRVVRQQFRIVEGDPFNPREIRNSAERIRALGFFTVAEVEAREGTAPDQVVIDVDVEEAPTGSLTLGGSFSTSDGFGIAVGLSERNFLGRGQTVALNWSSAEDSEQYTLGFTEPYLLGRDLSFGIDLGYSEADSSFASYDSKRAFFLPTLTFPVSENGRVTLSYSWSDDEMLSRDPSYSGDVIDNEIADGPLTTSAVGIGYRFDSRLTGLNPNAGFLFDVNAEFAGLGGDNSYVKTTARATAQTKIFNEEVTLRADIEGGALSWRGTTSSRAIDRFLLGPDIMRGFEPGGIGPRETGTNSSGNAYDDSLGGNLYAVLRLEAEFPLGLPEELGLRGAFFYDVGNLWDLSNVDQSGATGLVEGASGSFRHVIGVSLLWETALGPLRFNFSKALKKETYDKEQSFDLTVSAQF